MSDSSSAIRMREWVELGAVRLVMAVQTLSVAGCTIRWWRPIDLNIDPAAIEDRGEENAATDGGREREGRGERIRTSDHRYPIPVRYRAAPRPDWGRV